MSATARASTRGYRMIASPRAHPNSVAESTWNLFNTKRYCDVKFLVGPNKTEILAHKLLLMARSSVFATMFADRWTFNGNGDSMTVVTMSDADPDIFRLLLRYIYTDHFAPDISKACSLCELADKYDIAPLVKKCDEYISNNFSEEQSIEVFQWARSYSLNKLMDKAGGVMAGTFEKLLGNNDMLKAIDRETLTYLLKRDDLDVAEIQIFEITIKWAGIQASSSKQKAEDILKGIIPCIRFPLMDVQDFIRTVVPTNLLPKDDVIALFTYFNANGELRKTIGRSIQYSAKGRVFNGRTKVKIELYKPCEDDPNMEYYHQNINHRNGVSIFHNDYVEEIRFNYNLIGNGGQLALLTGLTLKIPDLQTHYIGRHEPLLSEYFVNIKTYYDCSTHNPLDAGQRVKLLRGVETKVELQQNCELKRGYSYTIKVAFEGPVPLLNRISWTTEPDVDALNDSFIPHHITQPVNDGNIKLSDVMFRAKTDSYHGYHAVKHLHLQLENHKVQQARKIVGTPHKTSSGSLSYYQ